jgi:hypothetical protein
MGLQLTILAVLEAQPLRGRYGKPTNLLRAVSDVEEEVGREALSP